MRIEKFFHSQPLTLQKKARIRPEYVYAVEISSPGNTRRGSSYGRTPAEAIRKARQSYSINTAKKSRSFKQLMKKIRQRR